MYNSRYFLRWVLLLALSLQSSLLWAANQVSGVRIWPSPDNTRVVLDMKKAPKFSSFTLENPNRVVIDIEQTEDNIDIDGLSKQSELIRSIRYSSEKKAGSLRLVIEVTEPVVPNIFSLPPTGPYGDRLVVDLTKVEKKYAVAEPSNELRDVVIAVDAGHGGEDPGSIGQKGTYEKQVTLAVAKKVAELINQEPGMTAVMIRSGDYFVNLNRRTELARKKNADMFVSIHADSFTSSKPHGASVWVLSLKRANTEIGKWLEDKEKHSELLGGAGEVLQDTQSERYLAQALLDMSMDHAMQVGHQVAKRVLKQFKQVTHLHKSDPQAASLAVLKSPDIPSILVELGFISNPTEERNLTNSMHQDKLARAIVSSIKSYYVDVPPDNTRFAKQQQQQRDAAPKLHVVVRGDTLSRIARRYNVSVDSLKQLNSLKSDVVHVGQKLRIP